MGVPELADALGGLRRHRLEPIRIGRIRTNGLGHVFIRSVSIRIAALPRGIQRRRWIRMEATRRAFRIVEGVVHVPELMLEAGGWDLSRRIVNNVPKLVGPRHLLVAGEEVVTE